MAPTTILTLVGSLRAASINRELAVLAAQNAPGGVLLSIYDDLGRVPFYNEDLDGEQPPAAVTALRSAAAKADAALFVTPENNGTIPAVLKNAIDWLSRPYGAGGLKDKPVVVIGAALGGYGGTWAHADTRKSVGIAGARVVEDLEFSLPIGTLDGRHPAESSDVVDAVRAVVARLATEVHSEKEQLQ